MEVRFLITVPVSGRTYEAGDVAVIPNHKAVGLLRRGHAVSTAAVESTAKKPVIEKATKKAATKRA